MICAPYLLQNVLKQHAAIILRERQYQVQGLRQGLDLQGQGQVQGLRFFLKVNQVWYQGPSPSTISLNSRTA